MILLSSKESIVGSGSRPERSTEGRLNGRGCASGIRLSRRTLSRVEISVCPGSGNPYKRPDFPPIPIISGLFSPAGRPHPNGRKPHSGADSRPHGGDPPARQTAAGYRWPADDRPRAAPGRGGRIGRVAVATDTPEIAAAVKAAGGEAVMTRADHPSGSDRIHEAMRTLDPAAEAEIVVNLQGDFPTIAPDIIRAVLPPLDDPAVDIATLAAQIHPEEEDRAPERGEGGRLADRRRTGCARSISPAPPRPRRRAALPPHRPLCLSPRRAGAIRSAAALAAGATGEAGAAARAGGRDADRHHHRRHASRAGSTRRPTSKPPARY